MRKCSLHFLTFQHLSQSCTIYGIGYLLLKSELLVRVWICHRYIIYNHKYLCGLLHDLVELSLLWMLVSLVRELTSQSINFLSILSNSSFIGIASITIIINFWLHVSIHKRGSLSPFSSAQVWKVKNDIFSVKLPAVNRAPLP